MAQITVITPFTYTFNDGKLYDFKPGSYEVPDDVADHWFVKAHGPNPPQVADPHAGANDRTSHPLVRPIGGNNNEPFAPNPALEPAPKVNDGPYMLTGQQTPPPSPIGASGGPIAGSDDNRTLAVKEQERKEKNTGIKKTDEKPEDDKK